MPNLGFSPGFVNPKALSRVIPRPDPRFKERNMARKGPNIHLVPSATKPGKFVGKEAGNPDALTRPASQEKSIEKAIPLAKQNQSDVVYHRRDASIRDSDSYGPDPNPPKDT